MFEQEESSPPSVSYSRVKKFHMRQYLKLLQQKEQLQEKWRAHYEDEQFKIRNQGQLTRRKELCILADKHEEWRNQTRAEIQKLKNEIETAVSFEAWRDILIQEGIDLETVKRQELTRLVEFLSAKDGHVVSSEALED